MSGLEQEIKDSLLGLFDRTPVAFNVEKVTDPLIEYIDTTFDNFTTSLLEDLGLNGTDCNLSGRRLQEDTNSSLADKIKDAISSVNGALSDLGITIEGEVMPYFDGDAFAVGVEASLTVTFEQSAAGIIEIVSDFFNDATGGAAFLGIDPIEQPSSSPSTSSVPTEEFRPSMRPSRSFSPSLKPSTSSWPSRSVQPSLSAVPSVSLQPSPTESVVGDFEQLLNDTVISAGFDISFSLELSLGEVQGVITEGDPLGDALSRGFQLSVSTWGAFASLVIDPINLSLDVGSQTIGVRDSFFSITADLRSKGPFSATAEELKTGMAQNTSQLVPVITVPLSAEVILDVDVGSISVSPM